MRIESVQQLPLSGLLVANTAISRYTWTVVSAEKDGAYGGRRPPAPHLPWQPRRAARAALSRGGVRADKAPRCCCDAAAAATGAPPSSPPSPSPPPPGAGGSVAGAPWRGGRRAPQERAGVVSPRGGTRSAWVAVVAVAAAVRCRCDERRAPARRRRQRPSRRSRAAPRSGTPTSSFCLALQLMEAARDKEYLSRGVDAMMRPAARPGTSASPRAAATRRWRPAGGQAELRGARRLWQGLRHGECLKAELLRRG